MSVRRYKHTGIISGTRGQRELPQPGPAPGVSPGRGNLVTSVTVQQQQQHSVGCVAQRGARPQQQPPQQQHDVKYVASRWKCERG